MIKGTILFTCSIAIMCGCCYSNRIVQPLTKLTEYAKSINSNATKKSLTQDIKIDLDEIKASDKIGELIEAFKNLVKGLSGLKKGARTEMAAGNEKINFPINFYYGTKMKWRHLLEQLKNYEEKKEQGGASDKNGIPSMNLNGNMTNNGGKTENGNVNQEIINRIGQEQLLINQMQDFNEGNNNMRSNLNFPSNGINANDIKIENIQLNMQDENKFKTGSNPAMNMDQFKKIDDDIDNAIFQSYNANKEKSD